MRNTVESGESGEKYDTIKIIKKFKEVS